MWTKITKYLKRYTHIGKHRSSERAVSQGSIRHVARHAWSKLQTPYQTPGRATNRGNWGDEDTGMWQVVLPLEFH